MVEQPPIEVAPLTPKRLLWRGVTKRCPVCAERHLFRRWFSMVDTCPRCGLRFEREQGGFIGAIGMNTIVSFGAILVTLVGGFVIQGDQRRVAPMLIALVAVAVIVPLAFFGSSQTLWSAVDLAMRPLEPAALQARLFGTQVAVHPAFVRVVEPQVRARDRISADGVHDATVDPQAAARFVVGGDLDA
jgi:uncharacterized protein (DUF983 family)